MANLALTMERFSVAEPMKKHRFLIQFQNLPGTANDTEGLSIACHSCTVPKLSISDQTLHRFNDRVYVPGKGEFETVEFEFYEYINVVDQGAGTRSAGDLLWNWLTQVYNPSTGASGKKKDVKTNILIVQFDGEGNVVRTWNLYYAWPTTVDFDGLDSTSEEVQNVKVTVRYDWASMNETAMTATSGATGGANEATFA